MCRLDQWKLFFFLEQPAFILCTLCSTKVVEQRLLDLLKRVFLNAYHTYRCTYGTPVSIFGEAFFCQRTRRGLEDDAGATRPPCCGVFALSGHDRYDMALFCRSLLWNGFGPCFDIISLQRPQHPLHPPPHSHYSAVRGMERETDAGSEAWMPYGQLHLCRDADNT